MGSRFIDGSHKLKKWLQTSLAGGITERRDVLRGIGVRRRKTVGDGDVAKVRKAVESIGTPGSEETPVVVLSVDKSDEEAFRVKDLG